MLIAVGVTPLVHNDGSENNAVCVDGGGGDDGQGDAPRCRSGIDPRGKTGQHKI